MYLDVKNAPVDAISGSTCYFIDCRIYIIIIIISCRPSSGTELDIISNSQPPYLERAVLLGSPTVVQT